MRGLPTVFALAILAGLLCVPACSRSHPRDEAALLEAELTVPALTKPERSVSWGKSTTGRDIQTVTITFLIDQPVFQYREHVNSFLLARGYTQALNITTPGEFSLVYDGLEGNLRVEVMAEMAATPASPLPQLPADTGADAGPPSSTPEDSNDNAQAEPAPPETPYRKVTVRISF